MFVNDIPSQCLGDCSFSWTEDIELTMTVVSPGTGTENTVITIDGTGFGNDVDSVTIDIGGALCDVTSVTDTQIVCAAGQGNI